LLNTAAIQSLLPLGGCVERCGLAPMLPKQDLVGAAKSGDFVISLVLSIGAADL
jgi:hypothetical protein